jgi:hypothetical protein
MKPDLHWPALGIRVMSRETPCSSGLAQQSAAHCANRCPGFSMTHTSFPSLQSSHPISVFVRFRKAETKKNCTGRYSFSWFFFVPRAKQKIRILALSRRNILFLVFFFFFFSFYVVSPFFRSMARTKRLLARTIKNSGDDLQKMIRSPGNRTKRSSARAIKNSEHDLREKKRKAASGLRQIWKAKRLSVSSLGSSISGASLVFLLRQ